MNTPYVRYAPRRITAAPARTVLGYRLTEYRVVPIGVEFEPQRFASAETLIATELPATVDADLGRPGVGFFIAHQGATGDYLVLAWWDQQNELPLRVWCRGDDGWRPARASESVCVWDLEIIWFERNAWIETALSGASIDVAITEYLSRRRAHPAADAPLV